MSLPEKEYYSLPDIAERWHVPLSDIQYYAAHGILEILVWLQNDIVNVYSLKKTEDGEKVPVPSGLKAYKGYAVLEPDQLRGVFRGGSHQIRQFKVPANQDLLEIHGSQAGYQVTVDDLVISRDERDRIEICHAMACSCSSHDSSNCQPISLSGRPSAMNHVRQHFMERCERKQTQPSLQKEAVYLSNWAIENIKEGHLPKLKTIKNAIRADYRQYSNGVAAAP